MDVFLEVIKALSAPTEAKVLSNALRAGRACRRRDPERGGFLSVRGKGRQGEQA